MRHNKVLLAASVASMIDQFNMANISLLKQLGYEVHVACNFQEGNTCNSARIQKLQKNLTRLHVIWHQWDCPRGTGSVQKCLQAYDQLLELLTIHAYAWMHCHSPVGGVLARIAAHKKGIPVVYTAHGFHFYQKAPFKNWLLYYPVEKLLSRWTDVLVTVNREDHCFARRRLSAGRVCYIPGIGVNTKLYAKRAVEAEKREFRSKYGLPQDAVVLLSVGELSSRKNHQLALAAVGVLAAAGELAGKKICYLICGQGPMQKELDLQAETLGIAAAVQLTGYQEDLQIFYQNADIFVFPSIQEGLPVALMEAMASGLPCVVSDIRGNRELISRKFRIPLEADAPYAMARLLKLLIGHPSLRKEEGCRNQRKVQRYGQKAVQKKMSVIYKSMDGYKEDRTDTKDRKKNRDSKNKKDRTDTKDHRHKKDSKDTKDSKNKKDHKAGKKGKKPAQLLYRRDNAGAVQPPEISVIMGTYNDRRAYAAQSIDSILGQTVTDLELIICDDGSEESYFRWLRNYCKKDQRIFLLRNSKNQGLAAALNHCLRYASGKYVARMDADDLARADRFQKQAAFLDRHPEYAFAGCSARLIAEHGPWGVRRLQRRPVRHSFLSTSPFIHPSVMFRRETLEVSGGYETSKKALRAEDYELFMRLYAAGQRGYNLPQLLLDYREDRSSFKRRRYRYRFCECMVRLDGFHKLGILKGNMRYVLKPLAAGLVPHFLMRKIRRERFCKKSILHRS